MSRKKHYYRRKRRKRTVPVLLALVVLILGIAGYGNGQADSISSALNTILTAASDLASGAEIQTAYAPSDVTEDLTVHFLDIGQGDCTLLTQGGHAMLIDAGYEKSSDELLALLEKQGVSHLEALVLTHFDKDHVGGADHVLEELEVDRLLTPDYQEDSKQYEQFAEAAREAGLVLETFTDPLTFQLGGSDVSVYPPLRSSYEDDNDYSLAVMVQHGIDSFLFPGDAEQTRLDELMAQTSVNCTFLKVPHHGRVEANSGVFFRAASPQYAVITCDSEGPDSEVMSALNAVGAQVYLTSRGPVQCVSDGANPMTVTQPESIDDLG